jgi:hypothetical protein
MTDKKIDLFFNDLRYEVGMGQMMINTFEKKHGRTGSVKEVVEYWNRPSTRNKPRLNLRYLTGGDKK